MVAQVEAVQGLGAVGTVYQGAASPTITTTDFWPPVLKRGPGKKDLTNCAQRLNIVSKLRSEKWKCSQWFGRDNGVDRGLCGDVAAYRCNACRKEFCLECWIDHLHMSIVCVDGVPNPQQANVHGK